MVALHGASVFVCIVLSQHNVAAGRNSLIAGGKPRNSGDKILRFLPYQGLDYWNEFELLIHPIRYIPVAVLD